MLSSDICRLLKACGVHNPPQAAQTQRHTHIHTSKFFFRAEEVFPEMIWVHSGNPLEYIAYMEKVKMPLVLE